MIQHRSFVSASLDVTRRALRAGGHMPLSLLMAKDAKDRLPFSAAGYSSNRWIKYVDAYLHGGRPFLDFVDQCEPRNSGSTFLFGGAHGHARGPCLVSMTVTSELVHVNARVMHWVNAGVLDLNFLWLLTRKFERPVWLTCPRVSILDYQLASYALIDDLNMRHPLIARARSLRKNPEQLTWDRHRKKAKRSLDFGNTDEEEMVLNFPRVTPEDIARVLKIKGTKMRNILRAEYGYSMKGDKRLSHSWASYKDPRFIRVAQALKINVRKLPSIDAIVAKRVKERKGDAA